MKNIRYKNTENFRLESCVIDQTITPFDCILIGVGYSDLDRKTPAEVAEDMADLILSNSHCLITNNPKSIHGQRCRPNNKIKEIKSVFCRPR